MRRGGMPSSAGALLFFPAASAAAAPGDQVQHKITVTDPDARLGSIDRTFRLALPYATGDEAAAGGAAVAGGPYPVLFYFHGQYGYSSGAAAFSKLGASEGFVTVAPQGLGDGSPLGLDKTWNVGNAGRTDTCKRSSAQCVMTSCKKVDKVSPCNWATCWDDVHFVKMILQTLQQDMKLSIDTSRMYLTGQSNGGMMTDYLPIAMPGVFAAAVPWYGAFLENYLPSDTYKSLKGTSFLSLHGTKDQVIPPKGGESNQQYLYISQNTTVSDWAKANGCDSRTIPASTPYDDDGDASGMSHTCVEQPNCKGGASVMYCEFHQQAHGFWPSYGEKLTWWYLSRRRLATAV